MEQNENSQPFINQVPESVERTLAGVAAVEDAEGHVRRVDAERIRAEIEAGAARVGLTGMGIENPKEVTGEPEASRRGVVPLRPDQVGPQALRQAGFTRGGARFGENPFPEAPEQK